MSLYSLRAAQAEMAVELCGRLHCTLATVIPARCYHRLLAQSAPYRTALNLYPEGGVGLAIIRCLSAVAQYVPPSRF